MANRSLFWFILREAFYGDTLLDRFTARIIIILGIAILAVGAELLILVTWVAR